MNLTMNTIYEHQFKITQSHEGFFMASGHHLNEQPMKFELLPLPTPQFLSPGEKVRLEISSSWQIELSLDAQKNWRGTVKSASSQLRLPPCSKEGVYFDEGSSEFFIEGQRLPPNYLSQMEHELLKYLYQYAGVVCTYHTLALNVWGGGAVTDNTIAQKIYQLRKKLRRMSASREKAYIETCRGYRRGYMLVG